MNALTIDSVLLVPVPEFAEPAIVPDLRSRKAQPKKLALPGPLTAPGEAGARRVGGGGGACATIWTLRVSGCDGPAPAATALLPPPRDASAIRVVGTASRASPTTAATQVARTQRGRIGERTPHLQQYGVRRLSAPGQRRVKGIRAGPGPGAPPVLLHFLAHTPRWL